MGAARIVKFSARAATEKKLQRDLKEEALILVGLVLEHTTTEQYEKMKETCDEILELATEMELREHRQKTAAPA